MRILSRNTKTHPAAPTPTADGLLGPPSLELRADRLRIGERWQRTFAVSGYPREVGYGWLAPLLRGLPQLELSLHIEPFPAEIAAQRLHKQRARFESTRRIEAERGSLTDLGVAAAAEDAHQLADRLARAESRLFRAGLYLSVSADSEDELEDASARVRALCAAQLLTCIPASFRPLDGWLSTLPLGLDRLQAAAHLRQRLARRLLPLRRRRPAARTGRLLLRARRLRRPRRLRPLRARQLQRRHPRPLRRRQELPRQTRSAPPPLPGRAGVRRRPRRRIPPTLPGGRRRLPAARRPRRRLPQPARPPRQPATERSPSRAIFLTELVELLAGGLSGGELAALDRATRACYAAAGIDDNPRHPPPAGAASCATSSSQLAHQRRDGARLAERLSPYSDGSLSQLFAKPTSVRPDGQLVCFSLRGLSDRLKPVALHALPGRDLARTRRAAAQALRARRRGLAVDARTRRRRLPATGSPSRARKRWCGLTTITQDAGDLLASELGQAIVDNAASHILLRQAPQAIERVADAFRLTDGEQRYLLSCPRGHGLFVVGDDRFPLQVLASPGEHPLVTSDPAELAAA